MSEIRINEKYNKNFTYLEKLTTRKILRAMSASSINTIIYDLFISLAQVDLSAESGRGLKSMATLSSPEAKTNSSKHPEFLFHKF